MASEPTTLQEAMAFFSDPKNCREYVVARRWPNGVTCPRCGSAKVTFLEKYNRWQCGSRHANRQFTLKTGTIFEDSPLGMDKWLIAMWLVVNCKNGVSSYEIQRGLGVTQKTAWFMDHRIRLALQLGSAETQYKFFGEIEADETFIGGKAANMHADKREQVKGDRKRGSMAGKAIVTGLLERNTTSRARVKVMPSVRQFQIRTNISDNVVKGSTIYSDALKSYRNVGVDGYAHEFIDHTEAYVNGRVHTNCMENFWSLLKRALKGTYVSVEPFHLQRYCDEQVFRFNNRKMKDADRMDLAIRGVAGRRVTYKELIGETEEAIQS